MKRSLMVGLMAASMIVSPFAALKQNDKAPDFATKASLAGKEFDFSLKAALAKGPVVVYFYPSASPAAAISRRTRSRRTRRSSMRPARQSSVCRATVLSA
jgi:hypothetical protein